MRKLTALILCLAISFPPHLDAAIAYISGTSKDGTTTDAIDTTGANLIVCSVAFFGSFTSFTDSQSNTWTQVREETYFGTATNRMYYTAAPSTSASHTFTLSAGSPRTACASFSGAHASPADLNTGNLLVPSQTIQAGSLDPSEDNCVIVSALYYESGGAVSIDSGFTGITPLNQFVGIAYKIQTTHSAENPTWTATVSQSIIASINASFKAAAGGGGGGAAACPSPFCGILGGK